MEEIKLTQTQVNTIQLLAPGDVAVVGLVRKKFDGTRWYRLEWLSEGENGNWNIDVKIIVIDNRDRNVKLASATLDTLQDALREEVRNSSLTLAQASTLFVYVADVLLALKLGWLQESRVICNALNTTTVFTTARKNFMLARIDEAIALI